MVDFIQNNPLRRFENLTLGQFDQMLVPDIAPPDREKLLEKAAKIMVSTGRQDQIDGFEEVTRLADLFIQERADDPYNRSYPSLLSFSIRKKDYLEYEAYNSRQVWKQRRNEVRETFALDRVTHPFAKLFDLVEADEFDNFRGLPVFEKLPDQLLREIPGVRETRRLNVLYPGSGAHIAPLFTAMILIDQGVIDMAEYTYTEIHLAHYDDLLSLLKKGEAAGTFEYVERGGTTRASLLEEAFPHVPFDEKSRVQSIMISYNGKWISIRFANRMSGGAYYRDEYFEKADLVVLHDPGSGYLEESYDLLGYLLYTKATLFPDKPQLVVMEGRESPENRHQGQTSIPYDIVFHEIEGPYGHCGNLAYVGEVTQCDYQSAFVFPLHQRTLLKHAEKYLPKIFCPYCEPVPMRPSICIGE